MDQRVVANLAEMTEANNNIKLLQQQLAEANKDLLYWKVLFEVQVIPTNDRYDIQLTASAGGRVVNEIISQDQALYFVDDIQTLVLNMTQRLMLALLTDMAVSDLSPILTKAIHNVEKLTSKKKGFF